MAEHDEPTSPTPTPNGKDPRSERPEGKTYDPVERLSFLLNATVTQLKEITDRLPQHEPGQSQEMADYIDAVALGRQSGWDDGQFDTVFECKDADWVQVVEADGERLAIAKPGLASTSENKVSGDTAQFLAREALGKGSMVQVPLWRTGIWVTLKTPKLIDLIELDRRLTTHKISLGRELFGNIFSNQMVYTVGILVDFILDHVYTSTLKSRRKDDLRQLIRSTDLMQLVNGLAATIYPKGYPLEQPCVANPDTCNHVDKAMVSLVKLSWTDRSALSEEQLRHMANREARWTVEEVKAYQEKHTQGYSLAKDLTDSFRIVFKEPSIDRYLRAGYEWVESIVASCERVFDKDASAAERRAYIEDQAARSTMRRWSHWIDKFLIGEKEISDPATIAQIVSDTISPDEEFRDTMVTAVRELIDSSTITVIGVPKYACPACGEEPEPHPVYPQLMSLNPISYFFHLLGQRLITTIDTK